MRWLQRLQTPALQAMRDAGPPLPRTIAAIVGGMFIGALVLILRPDLPFAALVLPPLGLTLLVSSADRDGATIRGALAYVALEQRRRTGARSLPVTKAAADAWLSAGHEEASALERAAVMITARRFEASLAAIDAAEKEGAADAVEAVRIARLRAAAQAALDPSGRIDLEAIRRAAAGLSDAEGRYQVVSAAWTQAWLDITSKRPWRMSFLAEARKHAPYELPARVRLGMAVQQYVGPVACVLAGAIVIAVQTVN